MKTLHEPTSAQLRRLMYHYGRYGRAIDRFFRNVDFKPGSCWFWLGGKDGPKGYARFMVEGLRLGVHRISYFLNVGDIPVGMQIDHLCREPRCVNHTHLEPVSAKENVLRGVGLSAENARKFVCKRGHPFDRFKPNSNNGAGARACKTCTNLLYSQKREVA